MHRRKSVFAPSSELSLEDSGLDPDAPGLPPDSEYLRGELRAVLNRVIAELPAPYRAVVLLRDIEELSTEEAAEILDVSSDVIKTRLHRGRAAMRQKLDCYLHNRCLEGQETPSPAPLTESERQALRSVWRSAIV
jgi:RNA polymerase sigma-70 factor (ECF subfamily)